MFRRFVADSIRRSSLSKRHSYLGPSEDVREETFDPVGPSECALDDLLPAAGERDRRCPLPDVSTLRALSAECNFDGELLAARLRCHRGTCDACL
jgi:hypothetical protein